MAKSAKPKINTEGAHENARLVDQYLVNANLRITFRPART
jgi:hypothetical protein